VRSVSAGYMRAGLLSAGSFQPSLVIYYLTADTGLNDGACEKLTMLCAPASQV